MRFWDTSALVPLLLTQEASPAVESLVRQDPHMAAWWGTPLECASAAARLRREGEITPQEESRVLVLLGALQSAWLEVLPSEEVRAEARRLLRVHPLRAADALQLAAALTWSAEPVEAELVTFDERLALAARLEGFTVLPLG